MSQERKNEMENQPLEYDGEVHRIEDVWDGQPLMEGNEPNEP